MANGGVMIPQSQATVPLSPALSKATKYAYSFKDLKMGSLVSLRQLCDDDCITILSRYNFKILNNNQVVITGRRNQNGLWDTSLSPPPQPVPNTKL